ncbi:MAG: FtsX-like permease family protein [Dactylosporangium sp.]|nr:ABC transporter permease [Dactylosporangium sp.]NNJ63464.1 FtsX-like permease family protein [Dactylosporangium sp.]
MLRATVKSLLSRKLRLTLSAMAVVLGVMFVAGAFVLTDTIGRSFDSMFTTAFSTIDVQVVSTPRAGQDSQDTVVADPVPERLVDTVQDVDGVATATGVVFVDGAKPLSPKTGKILSGGYGMPSFGGNWVGEDDLIQLRSGRSPTADDEVVINAGLAGLGKFAIDGPIDLLVTSPDGQLKQTFTIVGIFGYSGDRDSLIGETTTMFTTATAQRLLYGQEGLFSEIDVVAADGQSPTALRDRIRQAVGPSYQVKTGEELAETQSDAMREGLSFINYILLGFAGIALFVGVFIILNTFSIIVAQRMRELALIRALGASRNQILAAVLAEALVIGLIASVVGLGAGVGIGWLIAAFFDLSIAGIGVPANAIIASFAVGIIVTVVAAFLPALRASRIPPMAALQEAATPDRPLTRITLGGGIITLGGATALLIGLTGRAGDQTLWTIIGGVLVTFIGIALLTPVIARPAVSLLGRVFAWSMPGELGRRNTARNPRRTAITAAALMVGVALVTAISTIFSSASASISDTLDKDLDAHLIVSGLQASQNAPTFSPDVLTDARALADVDTVAACWYDVARWNSKPTFVTATDDVAALMSISGASAAEGAVDRLGPGQVVLDDDTAKDRDLAVGSTVELGFSRSDPRPFTVVGIYHETEMASGLVVSAEEATDFRARDPQLALIRLDDEGNTEAVRDQVETLLADNPEISVSDRSDYVDQQTSMFDTILTFIQVLLALAMLIAVLGVINTLVLSIIERTRELGMLRAIGLSRAQTTRMITVESVVISLFGALLGVGAGAGLGAATVEALRDEGFTTLTFPVSLMVAYLVLAGIVGIIAAVFPAIRAVRLNILNAIAYE